MYSTHPKQQETEGGNNAFCRLRDCPKEARFWAVRFIVSPSFLHYRSHAMQTESATNVAPKRISIHRNLSLKDYGIIAAFTLVSLPLGFYFGTMCRRVCSHF